MQYPITLDECIEAVERAHREEMEAMKSGKDIRYGDIHSLALEHALTRLKRLAFAVEDIKP
jgi:hypothetical protein